MKLSSYMSDRGLTDGQFAELVESSTFAVGKWRREERIPRGKFLRKIAMVTGGAVTANDFHSSEPRAEQVA